VNFEATLALLPWAAFAAPAFALLAAVLIGLDALRIAARPRRPVLVALDSARLDQGEVWSGRLAVGSALLAFLCILAAILGTLGGTLATGPATLTAAHWFGRIALSMKLDAAGLAFALVIAAVGWAAIRFSRLYLHREAGYHRFLAGMCAFLGGMLLIALAGNAALAFVGWEIAGLSSWLLIGYAWSRPTATANARYAFVTNRAGDAGFVIALAIAALWIGSLEWDGIATSTDPLTVRLVCLGLLLAALVKSGQLPFTAWIARALEGPTPSSAVFYGALMVHAGVFVMIRIGPLLDQVPEVRLLMGIVGLATAIYAHLVARVQTDIKSALLFATVSQIGLIFIECALGWTTVATIHLVTHAAWRAWQFLLAPSVLELSATAPQGIAAQPPAYRQIYALALQRFHLDVAVEAAIVRPVVAIAADARLFDERVVGPAAGVPEALHPAADEAAPDHAILGSPGLAGRMLLALADYLQTIEARLLLQLGETPLTRLLRGAGTYLSASERLLEQPRYLLAIVGLTFVVIL
jgi:NADH:ubiquinone oxidoreductase subunit 4 (subunit M)